MTTICKAKVIIEPRMSLENSIDLGKWFEFEKSESWIFTEKEVIEITNKLSECDLIDMIVIQEDRRHANITIGFTTMYLGCSVVRRLVECEDIKEALSTRKF